MAPQAGDPRPDDGFTLVEVVVSLLVFALLSTAVVGLIVKTISTSGNATQRSVAANLAERQKEFLLGVDYTKVLSGTGTQTVDGQAYTVATTVTQVARSTTGNRCDSSDGATLAYKSIDVVVTWPAMGSTDPVRNSTLRQIPQAQAGATRGALSVSVKDDAGQGVRGIPVTLVNSALAAVGTAATDGYGCVVFSDLPVASYSARVERAGYVGTNNQQLQATTSKQAVAGRQGKFETVLYAPAGSITLSSTVPAGATVPALLGAGVSSTSYSTVSSQSGAVVTGSLTGLFPTAQKVWAGACFDSAAVVDNSSVPDAAAPPLVAVPLYAVPVRVRAKSTGAVTKTLKVSVLHEASDGCSTGETLLLSTAPNDVVRNLTVALPAGTWQLQVDDGTTKKLVGSPFSTATVSTAQEVSAP